MTDRTSGRVAGKVAFISGIARGQGRSHAVGLAAEGADIIGIDLCEDIEINGYPLATDADLAETVKLVEAQGRRIVAIKADVRDVGAVRAAVDAGVAEFGRLDIVVAQAGICPLGGDLPAQAFADVVDVNLVGVINTVHATLPYLSEGASIIAIGSLAALVPGSLDDPAAGPGGMGYSLAKRLVANYVNDLALCVGRSNIRVNAVHPTNCNTDMLNNALMYAQFRPDLTNPTREDALSAFPAMNLMPTPWVEPEDVSHAVLYLASDESRFVTGMQLRIDAGGYLKLHPFRL
ncbi:MAG: mycofactocin-coupled SDR family oxidoreductase [Pseudonocardia sp.]|nr:mycofactocin-coupled SDR family oxidoreductase [Pseudonocardia sp.]